MVFKPLGLAVTNHNRNPRGLKTIGYEPLSKKKKQISIEKVLKKKYFRPRVDFEVIGKKQKYFWLYRNIFFFETQKSRTFVF